MIQKLKYFLGEKYKIYINKFSKKIGLDLKYFLKGGFWISIFQVTNLFKAFILSIIFANFIEIEFFGKYNFITSILAFLVVFSIPTMNSTLIQAFSINKDKTYFRGLKLILKYSSIGSLILLFLSIYYFFIGESKLISSILIILALLFPFYSLSPYYQTYYLGKKKFKEYALINSISLLITLFSISILLLITKNLFIVILIPILLKIIFELYFTFFHIPSKIKFEEIDEENITHAKKTYFSHCLYVGSSTFEPILIGFYLGFVELAIYTIITLIPNQGKTLFNFITPTFLPKLSTQIERITKKDILKHLFKLEIIFLFFILSYVLLIEIIFKTLYSPYAEYTSLSLIYSICLLSVPHLLILYYLKAKLDTTNINKINYFAIISSILIIFPSIILLSFEEIIYAKVIQSILLILFSIYILLR